MRHTKSAQSALDGLEPEERADAARRLAKLRDGSGVEPLCRLVALDEAVSVRVVAEEALNQTTNLTARPVLRRLLRSPEWRVRLVAVQQLRRRIDIASVPHLCRAVRDSEPEVSRAAAEALKWIGSGATAEAVCQSLIAS